MLSLASLRIVAASFAFVAVPFASAVPAHAETTVANEAVYASALRTINPKLPEVRARAYARSVMADAWKTHLDPRFIMSIVTVESRWRANAVSRVGARGLGQLMPGTAHNLGVNAWSASDNLRGTSRYLKTLMDRFAGQPNAVSLAIAGYNAGPKAVERYRGIPPYAETRNYVVRVLRVWKELNGRIGTAFVQPGEAIATRTPEERQWVTAVESAVSPAALAQPPASAVPAVPGAAAAAVSTEPAGK